MRRLILLAALAPATAFAQPCIPSAAIAADGRVLGHLPYGETASDTLVPAPDGFALRTGCRVRPEVAAALRALLNAAAFDPTTGGELRGASCHRTLTWQAGVFCAEAHRDPAFRAISVAPPGHSEHATGYAVDFAIRPSPNCPDVEACMSALPPYRWLVRNAARFGFEQSFPVGSKQGVKWEPWHWRWVGATATAPGAAAARWRFARARRDYPANPAVR
ncbi:MAG: D-alanyl-D-alanine carboxypeptidase [Sphingomonas bacterium]|uniref:M15 family metallopeptidase n=1 Tax=Sphingomonas bacterium TaxID=1895847 RepID=UPI00261B3213|nr:M15 family metallopeptidase [Sphingomonas bacterium]MDB5694558.1 D-alanyl-D-alanine carboxypeptidase [Sphingomonas bacterium]